jgi:branched-chain amino acid transport system ATP-binding protein
MLELGDVQAGYGPITVLQGVSLRVPPGQVVALLGRNGVGKTTTLSAVMGLVPLRGGSIAFKGADLARLPPHRIAEAGIGLVPQGRKIFPSLSVLENLEVCARRRPGQRWDVESILDLFPHLRERLGHPGNKLSGGEQQMLAVGRALAGNPDLLLMDEPTEGLAPFLVQEVGRVIDTLRREGASILLVEQHVAFAVQRADFIYVLHKGQVVHYGPAAAFAGQADLQRRYLGI